jgi:cobalamin biosynthesis protein CobT
MSSQNTSETIFDSDDIDIGDLVLDRDTDHSDPAVVVNTPPKTADEWKAYTGTTVAEDNPEYPADASIIVVVFRNEILDEQPEMVAPDSPIPLQDLNEVGIKHYSFPAPRLRRADPETDDFEALEDLDDININSDDTDDESVSTSENEQAETSETSETDTEPPDTTATDQGTGTAEIEDAADKQDQELQQEREQELEQLTEFLRDNGVRSEVDGGVVVAEKLGQSYEVTLDGEVNGEGAFQDRLEQLASEYLS